MRIMAAAMAKATACKTTIFPCEAAPKRLLPFGAPEMTPPVALNCAGHTVLMFGQTFQVAMAPGHGDVDENAQKGSVGSEKRG